MTNNIYEFSFALAKEQGLEGPEHGLLGKMLMVMSEYVNQIPLERMAAIIEHLKQVNDFLIANPDQVPLKVQTFEDLVREEGDVDLIKLCEDYDLFDGDGEE